MRETGSLFTSHGFDITPPVVSLVSQLADAQVFLAAFGQNFDETAISGFYGIQGITSTPSITGGFNWEGFVDIGVDFETQFDKFGRAGTNSRAPAGNNNNADSGAWLVRTFVPVPEPATGLLVGSGLAAMSWYRRRHSTT